MKLGGGGGSGGGKNVLGTERNSEVGRNFSAHRRSHLRGARKATGKSLARDFHISAPRQLKTIKPGSSRHGESFVSAWAQEIDELRLDFSPSFFLFQAGELSIPGQKLRANTCRACHLSPPAGASFFEQQLDRRAQQQTVKRALCCVLEPSSTLSHLARQPSFRIAHRSGCFLSSLGRLAHL